MESAGSLWHPVLSPLRTQVMMQVPLLAFRSLGIGVNTRDLHTEAARDGAVPKALNIIPIPLSIVWNREFGRHILRDERMPLHLLPVRYGAT